jgi:hypothetical protein
MVGWRFLPRSCCPADSERATKPTPWYIFTWLPMTEVSPTTVPVQWSMKKWVPMAAPGCRSTPDRLCAHSVIMRGMRAMLLQVQLVRHALGSDGLDEGIGDDDLLLAQGGRVTIERGLDVGGQDFPQAWQVAEEFHGQNVRRRQRILVGQLGWGAYSRLRAISRLSRTATSSRSSEAAARDRRRRNGRFVEEAREKQSQKVGRDSPNRLSRRQVLAVEVIDSAYALVGSEQPVGEFSSVHGFDQFCLFR